MVSRNFRTVVLGNFDGVHKGHQKLINLGKKIADQYGEELAVFTFYPQMQQIKDSSFCYLLDKTQKRRILEQLHVDVIEMIPFNFTIEKLSPEEFVRIVLVEKLQARHVVVGFNYSFGYKGLGTPQLLKQLAKSHGITVKVMESYYVDGEIASSTAIRQYLRAGKVEKANILLGYFYRIEGIIVEYKKYNYMKGLSQLNINPPQNKMLPAKGLYVVKCYVNETVYWGMLNIYEDHDMRNNFGVRLKAILFNLDEDIYDPNICVELHHRLSNRFGCEKTS